MRILALGTFVLCPVPILFSAAGLAAQELVGSVLESETRNPIPSATVSLVTPGGTVINRVMSDSVGRFRLAAPAPGRYLLAVNQIGYAARAQEELRLAEGMVTEVEVLLSTEPVALSAVVVRTRSRRAAEEAARGTPLRLLARADIEELDRRTNPQHVSDLARAFSPDLVVKSVTRTVMHDGSKAICIESVQRVSHTATCDMVLVVLDGMVIEDPSNLLVGMVPDQVESMEFLKPTEGGIRYGTLGGNGVLLINTRGSGTWARRQGTASEEPLDAFGLAFTGAAAGLGSGLVGALAACSITHCAVEELSPNAVGFELGLTSLAIPLGTHLANHRNGNLAAGLLASTTIAAAGYAAWNATGKDVFFLATPVIQVLAAVIVERGTSRGRRATDGQDTVP